MIYYLVAMTVCFFAYREFKGISFDIGQSGGYGMGPLYDRGQQRGGSTGNDNNDDNERGAPNRIN